MKTESTPRRLLRVPAALAIVVITGCGDQRPATDAHVDGVVADSRPPDAGVKDAPVGDAPGDAPLG